jgi:hypothetical protein
VPLDKTLILAAFRKTDPEQETIIMANLPQLIAHADWGISGSKRVMAKAVLEDDRYRASATETVRASGYLARLRAEAEGGSVLAGFDFPLGLPWAFAERAGIRNFREFLSETSPEDWDRFCQPAGSAAEISSQRPFYPARPGGTRRAHLVSGLGLPDSDSLRRVTDWQTEVRRAACPMFWTLGANQVGKGALSGWSEVIRPALADATLELKIWPFDGALEELLAVPRVVVVETYPAEVYHWLDLPIRLPGRSKRNPEHRRECRAKLLAAAERLRVDLSPALADEIESGFGEASLGEDSFDALVGLLGIVEVARGERPTAPPPDDRILQVEGWILGQKSRPVSAPPEPLRPLDLDLEKHRRRRRSARPSIPLTPEELAARRSAAAQKAWVTMRAKTAAASTPEELAVRRSAASLKAWVTIRAKKAAAIPE